MTCWQRGAHGIGIHHLSLKHARALEGRSCKVGLESPGPVEDGAVEIGTGEVRPVDVGRLQYRLPQIEAREIETIQSFPEEIDGTGRDGCLDVRACHVGLGELV